MDGEGMRLLVANVVIPFATGAGLGSFLLFAINYLDVGGIGTLLAGSGASVFDLGLVPFSCAFGALSIGTKQALTFISEK